MKCVIANSAVCYQYWTHLVPVDKVLILCCYFIVNFLKNLSSLFYAAISFFRCSIIPDKSFSHTQMKTHDLNDRIIEKMNSLFRPIKFWCKILLFSLSLDVYKSTDVQVLIGDRSSSTVGPIQKVSLIPNRQSALSMVEIVLLHPLAQIPCGTMNIRTVPVEKNHQYAILFYRHLQNGFMMKLHSTN